MLTPGSATSVAFGISGGRTRYREDDAFRPLRIRENRDCELGLFFFSPGNNMANLEGRRWLWSHTPAHKHWLSPMLRADFTPIGFIETDLVSSARYSERAFRRGVSSCLPFRQDALEVPNNGLGFIGCSVRLVSHNTKLKGQLSRFLQPFFRHFLFSQFSSFDDQRMRGMAPDLLVSPLPLFRRLLLLLNHAVEAGWNLEWATTFV